jgi:hypothetical protein
LSHCPTRTLKRSTPGTSIAGSTIAGTGRFRVLPGETSTCWSARAKTTAGRSPRPESTSGISTSARTLGLLGSL